MKLHYSPTSPYVRKVNLCALELGLDDKIERILTNPWEPDKTLLGNNPLSKVPTLITDDGMVLFDSPVICEYLDTEFGEHRLLPASGRERWYALRLQALADGLLDASVLRLLESRREQPSRDWMDTQLDAAQRSLGAMEQEVSRWGQDFGLGQISVAAGLGYLDFRFGNEDWRSAHPALAEWYTVLAQRPSMIATVPRTP